MFHRFSTHCQISGERKHIPYPNLCPGFAIGGGGAAFPPNHPADILQSAFTHACVIIFTFFNMTCHQFPRYLLAIFIIFHIFCPFPSFSTFSKFFTIFHYFSMTFHEHLRDSDHVSSCFIMCHSLPHYSHDFLIISPCFITHHVPSFLIIFHFHICHISLLL